jgi:glycosyltransferase involved in cell wall biosynthesis
MGTPAISVAMSVYNGERFLAEAIESVLGQTFADLEFLIVDDGSTDGSRAMIEAYAAKDARIRPILRENRGLIASLNQMLDEARAPLVARMDADDVCLPERLAQQVAFLDAHPDYGVLGCWTVDID